MRRYAAVVFYRLHGAECWGTIVERVAVCPLVAIREALTQFRIEGCCCFGCSSKRRDLDPEGLGDDGEVHRLRLAR